MFTNTILDFINIR